MTPARAESEALADARVLYSELRFAEALEAYRRALVVKGNRPAEIAHIYERLAVISASVGSDDEALGYFKRLLCLNPSAQLSDGLSPKVQEPFDQARAEMKYERLFRLTQRSARPLSAAGGLALELELVPDSLGLAVGATLHYRQAKGGPYRTLAQEATGELAFTIAPGELPAGLGAEYFLEVNDAHGGSLWELGTATSPLIVGQPSADVAPLDASPVPDADRGGGEEGAWYQETWLWVGAGAAAVLLAAGVTTVAIVAATAPTTSTASFEPFEYEIAPARGTSPQPLLAGGSR